MYTQIRLNLIKILEALNKKKTNVIIKKNPETVGLLTLLLLLGYISGYAEDVSACSFKVFFKYSSSGRPFNLGLSRKLYINHKTLILMTRVNPRVTLIILTPRGISYTAACLREKSSGFLVAEIY